jgi:long-chain fatty acid transport protein
MWLTSGAEASPQEVIGFGYRSVAMGTTGAAVGEGVDDVYGNPALLSLERDMTLELGVTEALFHLYADGPGMPGRVYVSPLRGNSIGALLPLPFGGALEDRVTLGLGFFTPFDVVVRGRILYPDKPQFLLADRVQSVAVQAGLGADVGYGVRVGAGFAALAALSGSVVVATDASGRIGTVVKDTLVASYAPIVGASYDVTEHYRAGLTFRGELVGRFNVVIEAKDLGQITIPPLNISGVAQYDPYQLSAEFARVDGPWEVAIGLTWKHWSAYPGPAEATVRCEDAPDPDAPCAPYAPPDPDYSDTVVPRAGADRAFVVAPGATVHLRAGYAFEPSPAPAQEGATNYFDCHRSVFSMGWGLGFDEPLPRFGFDGFLQLQLLHARDHDKTAAAGAVTEGTIETRGTIVAAGAAGKVRF